ncbi:carbon-nitrogen hydrolase family protein [Virgisporangium aurantiacum]|uniref:carbon-nitrogen hydrolase family protein n=1 Tax=Virgisporangium aurantiacum TaxID=175570 RepID=UPI001EF26DF8|nr:carbon-nitrogen hydrolase family protein [Virgisporangium aurantiacum]
MRIGACQTPEILGDIEGALRVVREFAAWADSVEVDLLLFPECFLQGYLVTGRHVRSWAFDVTSVEFAAVLAALAGIRQTLVLGMIERSGGVYFNTALVIAGQQVIGRYRKTFLTAGESIFAAGDSYPVFDLGRIRFGINICYDTQFPQAAAAVAARHARVLLVPAQNMMRRDKARWWQDRHHEIRARRARETAMWLVSADVTGERDEFRIGLGPTSVLSPTGAVLTQVPTGTTGMSTLDIDPDLPLPLGQRPECLRGSRSGGTEPGRTA